MSKLGQNISKTGEWIKDNPKPLLYIAGAIAVGVIGFTLIKKIKGGVEGILSLPKSKTAETFTKQPIDATKATITEEQAKTYARQIWTAMNQHGTDEASIEAIIDALKTPTDYLMVFNAFELKTYVWWGAASDWDKLTGLTDDLDMNEWFKRELSPISDKKLWDKIKKISIESGVAF